MLQNGTPTPNPGRYFIANMRHFQTGTGIPAVGDQEMRLTPFQVSRTVTLDRMAIINDSNPGEDGIARIGIYTSGTDELPANLLVQSTDIDTDLDAVDTVYEFTISQKLIANKTYWYAVAWRRETAVNDNTWRTTPSFRSGVASYLGDTVLNDLLQPTLNVYALDVPLGAWTALPNPVSLGSATAHQGDCPAFALRVDPTDTPAIGPGHGYPLMAIRETDKRWYSLGMLERGSDTLVTTAGEIHYWPFYVQDDIEVEQMGLHVTGAGAGSQGRVGIYTDNNGVPGSLLVGSASLDTTATGDKTTSVTATKLNAGTTYWAACGISGGTPTIRAADNSTNNYPRVSPLGEATALAALDGTEVDTKRVETGWAGGALPTTAGTTSYSKGNVPNVGALIAPAP